MSREYAERRIRDALKQCEGNAPRACRQVMAWMYEDSKLLHELTKAHLGGIVAYNVERVASGRADRAKEAQESVAEEEIVPILEGEEFGMDLLRAIAGTNATVFGKETGSAPVKRVGASKEHIDALRLMASKSHTPPKKG